MRSVRFLLVVVTLILASSAMAWAQTPDDPDYWETRFIHASECYNHEPPGVVNDHGVLSADGKSLTLNPYSPSFPGDHWEAVIVNGGSSGGDGFGNAVYVHPTPGVPYFAPLSSGGEQPDVSHWIVCKGDSATTSPTTTTTQPPVTTTTGGGTTSTTTGGGTTSTTRGATTTTSTGGATTTDPTAGGDSSESGDTPVGGVEAGGGSTAARFAGLGIALAAAGGIVLVAAFLLTLRGSQATAPRE